LAASVEHTAPADTAAYRCLCFDFDGTLVNSMDAAFNALQLVGPAFGCAPLTRERLLTLRGQHLREVIQTLGIPFYRVPRMVSRLRKTMCAELMETPPIAGIAEALADCADHGYRLGILTSNARASVQDYCNRYGLDRFDFIVGGIGLFGKASSLRAVLRREGLGPQDLLYIGDELRDLDAARSAGVGFAAVGWGYTALESLAAAGPDHLFAHPAELVRALPERVGVSEDDLNKI
jgi:phosphoglycolate phosphatase